MVPRKMFWSVTGYAFPIRKETCVQCSVARVTLTKRLVWTKIQQASAANIHWWWLTMNEYADNLQQQDVHSLLCCFQWRIYVNGIFSHVRVFSSLLLVREKLVLSAVYGFCVFLRISRNKAHCLFMQIIKIWRWT